MIWKELYLPTFPQWIFLSVGPLEQLGVFHKVKNNAFMWKSRLSVCVFATKYQCLESLEWSF
jgi:hypothetical protein